MFFGNTSLIFGHCQQTDTSCPIGLSLKEPSPCRGYYPESLEVLRAAKEQQVVLGMISNHLAFWFHKDQGPAWEVRIADNQEPSKEMNSKKGLVGWMLKGFGISSFWCFSCMQLPVAPSRFLAGRDQLSFVQVDEIGNADAENMKVKFPSRRLQCLSPFAFSQGVWRSTQRLDWSRAAAGELGGQMFLFFFSLKLQGVFSVHGRTSFKTIPKKLSSYGDHEAQSTWNTKVACSKPGSQIFELFLQRVGKLHPGAFLEKWIRRNGFDWSWTCWKYVKRWMFWEGNSNV